MYFLIENPTHKKLFGVTRRWVGRQSCYSCNVLPRVVNIETAASEITKKEQVCHSMEIFKLFVRIITVFSPHFLSPFQASSLQGWSKNVLGYPLLGLIFPGLERGIFLNLKKTIFIIDAWQRKFFSQYSVLERVSFAAFLQVCNFITKRLQNRCFLWNLCVFWENFKNSFFMNTSVGCFWILFWFPS